MTSSQAQPSSASALSPHRALPALGLPPAREDRRLGAAISIVIHIAILAFLFLPIAVRDAIHEQTEGGGGAGPAGGGGGGHNGSGGRSSQGREQLQYIKLILVTAPAAVRVVPLLAVPPRQKPAGAPPPTVSPPPALAPRIDMKLVTPAAPLTVAAAAGAAGGTGHDGTNGTGPGTGGGVGSGIGTGRGAGVGAGTGGGDQANYPPIPTELFIPPLPMPDKVRGFHLVAEYDIDETGHIVSFDFTQTRDSDYNRRLADVLRSFRFRPGTRPDGTPIRMKAQIIYDF